MRLALVVLAALAVAAPAQAQIEILPTPTPTPTPGEPGQPAPVAPAQAPPVIAPPAPGTEAVAAGQDLARSGSSAVATLKPPLAALWQVRLAGSIRVDPLIADGRAYVVWTREDDPRKGTAEAFDIRSGARLWSRPLSLVANALAFDAGRLFIAGEQEQALDAATGEVLWTTRRTDYENSTGLLAVDGRVYAQGSALRALSQTDGAQEWTSRYSDEHGEPAIVGGRVYQDISCSARAVDRRTGGQIWRTSGCSNGDGGRAIPWRDRVFAGEGALAAFDGAELAGPQLSMVDGDIGLAPDGSAFDLPTGRRLWRRRAGQTLGLPGSVLVRGAADGWLDLRDLQTGRLLWSATLPGHQGFSATRPVAGEDVVLVPDGNVLLALAGRGRATLAQVRTADRDLFTTSNRPTLIRARLPGRLLPRQVRLVDARGRTLARGRPSPRLPIDLRFRVRRNTRVRVTASGFAPSAARRVYAYPNIHLRTTQSGGLVNAAVRVRPVPGIRLGGRTVVEYLFHRGIARRLGSTRLSSAGRGLIRFTPLQHVAPRDRIYLCLRGAAGLGLGARDTLARHCGAARVRF